MPEPRKPANGRRDLDGDGDIDLADDPSLDLDHNGRIEGEDREGQDIDADNDIDASDRALAAKQSVGAVLGMAKVGQNSQKAEGESQKQSSTGPKVR
ncbi:hypothetical protein [Prosthecobacter fluviatilis]|uniref:Uncharacterized protein n=1 Tax=Prosthecobacter fluviatilis TaxID=445931 RepID=A0ABW0KKR2_9BACT